MRIYQLLPVVALALSGCAGEVDGNVGGIGAEHGLSPAMGASEVVADHGQARVTICHVPPGNPANAHTITVGAPAVPAHMAHGDTMGSCGDCGDGVRSAAEECEGTDLGGNDCASLGFSEGTLACTSNCTLDSSGCTHPPGQCSTCNDCGGQACIGGACGTCTTSADCCSPLACVAGVCALVF